MVCLLWDLPLAGASGWSCKLHHLWQAVAVSWLEVREEGAAACGTLLKPCTRSGGGGWREAGSNSVVLALLFVVTRGLQEARDGRT